MIEVSMTSRPTSSKLMSATGDRNDHLTDYRPEQAHWSQENLPEIIYTFEKPANWLGRADLKDPPLKTYPIYGKYLRDIPILPDHISKDVEGWRLETWFRFDPRIRKDDLVNRMPLATRSDHNTNLSMRAQRFRKDANVLGWVAKGGKFTSEKQRLQQLLRGAGVDLNLNTTRGISWGANPPGQPIPVPARLRWASWVEAAPAQAPLAAPRLASPPSERPHSPLSTSARPQISAINPLSPNLISVQLLDPQLFYPPGQSQATDTLNRPSQPNQAAPIMSFSPSIAVSTTGPTPEQLPGASTPNSKPTRLSLAEAQNATRYTTGSGKGAAGISSTNTGSAVNSLKHSRENDDQVSNAAYTNEDSQRPHKKPRRSTLSGAAIKDDQYTYHQEGNGGVVAAPENFLHCVGVDASRFARPGVFLPVTNDVNAGEVLSSNYPQFGDYAHPDSMPDAHLAASTVQLC
jgi:hypothetical protein